MKNRLKVGLPSALLVLVATASALGRKRLPIPHKRLRIRHLRPSIPGAAISGIPVKEFALLVCMELGIMGVITPFADAASPIYANSGYLPAKDY